MKYLRLTLLLLVFMSSLQLEAQDEKRSQWGMEFGYMYANIGSTNKIADTYPIMGPYIGLVQSNQFWKGKLRLLTGLRYNVRAWSILHAHDLMLPLSLEYHFVNQSDIGIAFTAGSGLNISMFKNKSTRDLGTKVPFYFENKYGLVFRVRSTEKVIRRLHITRMLTSYAYNRMVENSAGDLIESKLKYSCFAVGLSVLWK